MGIEKTLNSKRIYNGKIIKVDLDEVELENGNKSLRECVKHPGGVGILAIKDGFVYLAKQFRYPYKQEIVEIPAGKLEKNEDPKEAGIREFKEELGATTKEIIYLGNMYPSVGYTDEIIYLYYSESFDFGKQELDEDEFIDIIKMPLSEFDEQIKTNKIKDAKTIIAYHLWKSTKKNK